MLTLTIDGSVSLIRPSDDDADRFWEWAAERIVADTMDDEPTDALPLQTWGGALVVETNYVPAIVRGLRDDGFTFGG